MAVENYDLSSRLEQHLPKDIPFKLHHVSTPPERTEALRPAPPGDRPEKTFCESHFLTISVRPEAEEVIAFAMEVFIYSTTSTTMFFVSKADSTGYLHLAKCPKGISPVKEVSAAFLKFLLDKKQRPGVTSIISLFARAQDQYLFPGSVENAGKHVLDDRGLVKWWCRVLDSIVKDTKSQAHLLVPGLDKYETMGLLPADKTKWSVGNPLRELFGDVPPRCVIPRFPDDPKARFVDELDDEIEGTTDGVWKSVKTLEQFWEMMAFRQECSAGRMVGFIWIVLKPENATQNFSTNGGLMTPNASFTEPAKRAEQHHSPSKPRRERKQKLTGPIVPRQPKVKISQHERQDELHRSIPQNTPYYTWPASSQGEVVVSQKEYKRITELLLRLDFANLELAVGSSRRWTSEVKIDWGRQLIGQKVAEEKAGLQTAGVATLNMGLVRKKRKEPDEHVAVNDLTGVIRKKAKA